MADVIRWGILGTGDIAHQFASDLKQLEGAELSAIGSRSREKAERFAAEFEIPHPCVGYDTLAQSEHVDVVYVGTPHVHHRDNTLLCLQHGKPVLCEKPFALNARQVEEMAACARGQRLFLMEAMWMCFFPAMRRAKELIDSGAIGDVRWMRADFCFRSDWNPTWRLLNRELGGGSLLDVGVYPVALAQLVFGRPPDDVASLAHLGETGVDEQAGIVFRYDGGALAVLSCAIRTAAPEEAIIAGTEGLIRLPRFSQPDRLILAREGREEEFARERVGYGYGFEAAEVQRCLHQGRAESDIMPLNSSLAIMQTLDRIRAQWNLVYPGE